ncbi:glycosyltransferase [Seonamhaeicola sp. NFXS20]|uniref:glycosyltransferase n=1 Tax=Seonamhaeicola sp. NFXS20 TaxID=2816959 RepID=UPI003B8E7164
MKVLQVINSLRSGGAEKLIVDTCGKFSEKGLKVDVLLLDGAETGFYKKLKENKSINIFSLGTENNIYNPFLVFKIKSFFKNYDIIHVHLFPALYWVGFANLLSFKKHNIVLTEHNTTNRRRKLFLFKTLDKIVYNQFNKIITISDAVDQNLLNHLGEKFKPKFIKIYNGINLESINLAKPYKKEDLHFSDADKLIIQVSSFTPQKDQKTLIRAVSKLPENFKLILVGQGPLEDACKQLANELGVTDKVHFYGLRNDVPRLLKTADVVVLSSFYEGLSLSSIEGMASEKPFVASDVPGLTEVVKNAGVLFKKEDDNELSKIILKLSNNSSYHHNVVESSLKKSKLFDINIMVDNYINLYKKIQF